MGLFNRFPREDESDLSVAIEKATEMGRARGYKEGWAAAAENHAELCDALVMGERPLHPAAAEVLRAVGRNSRALAAQIEEEVQV